MSRSLARTGVWVTILASVTTVMAGCSAPLAASGPVELSVWHHRGTDTERATFRAQVREFNAANPDIVVKVREDVEGDYNDLLAAAAARGGLPDVVEVDGPQLSRFVFQESLQPLDDLLPREVIANQLPSLQAQNRINDRTYAVSTFDSGLGLFADRTQLRRAGVRIPTGVADAWTAQEFNDALRSLAASDADRKVLDVKLNYGTGEWLTYGFAPLVASAGGVLLGTGGDSQGTLTATGGLDGPAGVRALGQIREWSRFAVPETDANAFTARRAPLSWAGHWVYRDYAKALGKDLAVLPLPDLGHGAKTAQGSWTWAVNASSERKRAASAFLTFLLRDRQIQRMTDANAAVPGTRSAVEHSRLYDADGPLRLFSEQLLNSCGTRTPDRTCQAVPRPTTPAYPVVTSEFAAAVATSWAGDDGAAQLSRAARVIDTDLSENNGYR